MRTSILLRCHRWKSESFFIIFQFVLLTIAICAANAGIIGGYGLGHGAVIAAAPAVHVAESYQNNNLISLHPTPIIVSHAAPVITKVAAAPVLLASHGLGGHGLSLHWASCREMSSNASLS